MTGESPGTPTETGQRNADANQLPAAWDMLFADLERRRPALFVDAAAAGWDGYGKYPLARYPRLRAYVDQQLPAGGGPRGRRPVPAAAVRDRPRSPRPPPGSRGSGDRSARTRRRRRAARRTCTSAIVAPASKVPKFPGSVGMTMAALMPTSVSNAVRKLGARWKAPWNSTSITISLDHPSSDRAAMAATRRGVDACSPDDSARCTRGHRPSRGTRQRPRAEQAPRSPRRPGPKAPAPACPSFVTQRGDEDQDGERQHLGAALRPACRRSRRPAAPCRPRRRRAARTRSPLPNPMAALASRPSMVAASTWRNGGGSIKRHPPARRLQRQEHDEVQQDRRRHRPGRARRERTVQGFSRHRTTAQQAQRKAAQGRLPACGSRAIQRQEGEPVGAQAFKDARQARPASARCRGALRRRGRRAAAAPCASRRSASPA